MFGRYEMMRMNSEICAKYKTREEMIGPACRAETGALHDKYYRQMLADNLIATVVRHIGGARILASTDEHFNDIPLAKWDQLEHVARPYVARFYRVTDYKGGVSLSDCVSLVKQAAKVWKEIKHEFP